MQNQINWAKISVCRSDFILEAPGKKQWLFLPLRTTSILWPVASASTCKDFSVASSLLFDFCLSADIFTDSDHLACDPYDYICCWYYCSVALLCLTLCDPMDCSTPGFPVFHNLLQLAQTHVHWVSDVNQTSPSPPAFNLSQHQGHFHWISSSHQVAKILKLHLQHHPSNEYSKLISFRIVCLDAFAIQETLKSLLQHNSLKVSVLQCSAFMVQLSHPYMTSGKSIALTVWTFVSKMMSLLFNTLSRFVIAFLPRSKHLLILWPQSASVLILQPKKIKSVTISIFSPSICYEVMRPDAIILFFF